MKKTADSESPSCRHHWLLGQPVDGKVSARCRTCGQTREFPASVEDYDWSMENERRFFIRGVATAAGGARPSAGALSDDWES
jgi:hypothetical protein